MVSFSAQRIFLAACVLWLGFACFAIAQNLQENMWITNGPVNAVTTSQDGSTIYLGGSFDYVGPVTGYGGALDLTTADVDTGMPRVHGPIYAVAPDGSGGWYIGGSFTQVGGLSRNYLARIKADKSVDVDFNPVPNSVVYALAVSGSKLYVAGSFSSIGDSTRYYVAVLDTGIGTVTGWVPQGTYPGANSYVLSLAVSDSTVYTAGYFTQVGDSMRNYIAAFDKTTGSVRSWNPNANNYPYTMAISGSIVYVGGTFTQIGNQTRNYIAALDGATGSATSWDPGGASINSSVNVIATSGPTVYVGGDFTIIGNQNRQYIAALDSTTGNATSWNPQANSTVYTLAIAGSTIYAGGTFSSIGGGMRRNMAGVDIATGNATSWQSDAVSPVSCLAVSGSAIYAGGEFISIGGKRRRNIAAFDAVTGKATSWDPSANSSVIALAFSGPLLYVGGSFDSVGGQWRRFIAAVDTMTGTATSWDPSAGSINGTVAAIAPSGSTVYIGGSFLYIGGENRYHIAAIDSATGNITAWDPSANGYVSTLAVDGTKIYAGGGFGTIGGESRQFLVALDATTGNATGWNPSPDGAVNTMTLNGSILYVGGSFFNISGQSRQSLAAFNASTGNLTVWNASASWPGYISSVASGGSTVYVGGNFSFIGGQTRSYLALVSASTGLATSWVPQLNSSVYSLALANSKVYAGGGFTWANNNNGRQYFAVFDTEEPAFFSSDSLNFGGVRKDTTKTDTVYVKNTGSSTLTLNYVWTGWSFYADPSGAVNQLITPGDSFGIAVTFTPSNNVGFFTGSLNLQFNSFWNQNIYLSGAGTDSTFSVNLNVNAGWNVVSNPVITPNDSLRDLFTTSTFPYGFKFLSTTGYVQEYTMFNGTGYWAKFPSGYSEWLSGGFIDKDSISVAAGWNLIGSISLSVDTAFIRANTNPPNIIASNFFSYPYGLGDPSVEPGRGYWVKANAPGKLFLAQNPGPSKPANPAQESPHARLNQLIISDAFGKMQTLYFGPWEGNGFNVSSFELPPLPPAGAFDARFETADGGFNLQVHNSEHGSLPIAVQSDAYPLEVSWKIANGAYTLADAADNGSSVYRTMIGRGTMEISNPAVTKLLLSLGAGKEIPVEFSVSQNYPNPFNPVTVIKYELAASGAVSLKVYDILGREVVKLVDGRQDAGSYRVDFNAVNLASGVYFYRLEAGTFVEQRKMLLLK